MNFQGKLTFIKFNPFYLTFVIGVLNSDMKNKYMKKPFLIAVAIVKFHPKMNFLTIIIGLYIKNTLASTALRTKA